jgi:hypothetical protein
MGILLPSLSVRRSLRQAFCLRLLALLLLLAFATPFSSSAQTPAGSIIGTVSEQHAGPLAGARVSVTSVQSGATSSIATDVNGRFTVENLPPGDYRVKIAADGFASQDEKVKIKPAHKSKVSVTLKPTAK